MRNFSKIVALAASGPVLAVCLAACGSAQVDAPASPTPMQPAPAPAPAADAKAKMYNLPPGAPPLAPDLLAIGTQDARDDLYCSALIYEENPDVSDALAPVDEALLRKAQTLAFIVGESGINKLVEQQVAHATHARAIADAYAALIDKDVAANKLRISVADCNTRAGAVKFE